VPAGFLSLEVATELAVDLGGAQRGGRGDPVAPPFDRLAADRFVRV
jgi:hypothetical protein